MGVAVARPLIAGLVVKLIAIVGPEARAPDLSLCEVFEEYQRQTKFSFINALHAFSMPPDLVAMKVVGGEGCAAMSIATPISDNLGPGGI